MTGQIIPFPPSPHPRRRGRPSARLAGRSDVGAANLAAPTPSATGSPVTPLRPPTGGSHTQDLPPCA